MKRILLYVQVFCAVLLLNLQTQAQGSYYFNPNSGYGRLLQGDAFITGKGAIVNVDSAIRWYNAALELNYFNAYAHLANIYYKSGLVPQDFSKAVQYYKKGSDQNDPQCEFMLGYCYFKGLGLLQSYESAALFFRRLANKNIPNAQHFLGCMFRNGYGMPANSDSAKYWLNKAAAQNYKEAIHELVSEPLPENKEIANPELLGQINTLKKYHEQFDAAATNDISGKYAGYAIYQDFSGKHIQKIVALELNIKNVKGEYTGTWTEKSDAGIITADIKGTFKDNHFLFDSSSQYTRNDQYSYEHNERYRFDDGSLNIKYVQDSLFLAGDTRFYSLTRKEPGQPMYIALSKQIVQEKKPTILSPLQKLIVSPNPASAFVKASFTLDQAERTQLLLTDLNGRVLQTIPASLLPAGSYTYSFNVQSLPAGTYVIQVAVQSKIESKMFIKVN
ncbi:T9SS type A sorting domain-containing protein [Pinibacter soli]|uniref:T9SS type A sorting domain-containing protein n=1 Tax=Pinibacter soli TaxID=3044211 RepID=A0ABT6RKX4_9BACT|nr:T9SS type A sorting domain-containing protein [Pinibacter soli]MDI3322529.1 T9SS type A sorting domain-containing protein [Pinibacter soli]